MRQKQFQQGGTHGALLARLRRARCWERWAARLLRPDRLQAAPCRAPLVPAPPAPSQARPTTECVQVKLYTITNFTTFVSKNSFTLQHKE